jgi:hypothetical protein
VRAFASASLDRAIRSKGLEDAWQHMKIRRRLQQERGVLRRLSRRATGKPPGAFDWCALIAAWTMGGNRDTTEAT